MNQKSKYSTPENPMAWIAIIGSAMFAMGIAAFGGVGGMIIGGLFLVMIAIIFTQRN